jgi:hypothetical protein
VEMGVFFALIATFLTEIKKNLSLIFFTRPGRKDKQTFFKRKRMAIAP